MLPADDGPPKTPADEGPAMQPADDEPAMPPADDGPAMLPADDGSSPCIGETWSSVGGIVHHPAHKAPYNTKNEPRMRREDNKDDDRAAAWVDGKQGPCRTVSLRAVGRFPL